MKEPRVMEAHALGISVPKFRGFPESFAKTQIDFEHIPHQQFLQSGLF